jgi:hypothetical protein
MQQSRSKTSQERKSATEGIDLEFERNDSLYLISIKSGPNWGNSSQIQKMRENFRKAKRILATNAKARPVICVNGCCYGRETNEKKGDYIKVCGESFWTLISSIPTLCTDIIEPLGQAAEEHDAAFIAAYGGVINRFTTEFIQDFCDQNGVIDWEKLVRFNSAKSLIKTAKPTI